MCERCTRLDMRAGGWNSEEQFRAYELEHGPTWVVDEMTVPRRLAMDIGLWCMFIGFAAGTLVGWSAWSVVGLMGL